MESFSDLATNSTRIATESLPSMGNYPGGIDQGLVIAELYTLLFFTGKETQEHGGVIWAIQRTKSGMPRKLPKLLAPSRLHSDEVCLTRKGGATHEPLTPRVEIFLVQLVAENRPA